MSRILATAILLFTACFAQAQQWDRFRGPNGSGYVPGKLPDQWDAKKYAWQITLPGSGYGSVVVAANKQIYLLTADAKTAQRSVVAVNMDDGKVVWKKDYASNHQHVHARNSYASGTPCCDDLGVYAVWSDDEQTRVVALDHSGKERWSANLGSWIGDHGFAASPMIIDDLVVVFDEQQKDQLKPEQVAGQSRMIALDRKTGSQAWSTDLATTRPCYGTPIIYQPKQGEKQIVNCNTGNGTFGLDPKTGKILWNVEVFEARCVSTPVIAGDLIVGTAGSGGGGNHLVAVQPGAEAKQVYRVEKQAPYVPTPVYKDGMLFCVADRGVAACFDAKTGEEIWNERLSGNFYASPIVVGDRMLCIALDGTAFLLNATREGGLINKIKVGESVEASPAFVDGVLLLRVDDKLMALDCRLRT